MDGEREEGRRRIVCRTGAAGLMEVAALFFPTNFLFFLAEVAEEVFSGKVNKIIYTNCAGALRYSHFFIIGKISVAYGWLIDFTSLKRNQKYQCRSPPPGFCNLSISLDLGGKNVRKEILLMH